jgi:hypothetical protein
MKETAPYHVPPEAGFCPPGRARLLHFWFLTDFWKVKAGKPDKPLAFVGNHR